MQQMNQAQIETFLQDRRHAIVATNAKDDAPQLSTVWYLYEDGILYFLANQKSVKVRNLRRDPRLTISIDGGYPDARYVIIRGTASIIKSDHPTYPELRWRLFRRYFDSDAEARTVNDATGDGVDVFIVIVTPTRISSLDLMSNNA